MKFKDLFFDRDKVIKAAGRARTKVLSGFGRLVRKRAQSSLAYGDKPSTPGKPPTAHKSRKLTKTSKKTGKTRTRSVSFLREFLYYQYDFTSNSVIVGPSRLDTTVDPAALPALEYGGTAVILNHGKKTRASIKARPFMRPALAAELPGLPAMWKDSIKP